MLSDVKLCRSTIRSLAKMLATLETVGLIRTGMGADGASSCCSLFLKTLNIGAKNLGDAGASIIAAMLATNFDAPILRIVGEYHQRTRRSCPERFSGG